MSQKETFDGAVKDDHFDLFVSFEGSDDLM